MKKLIVLTLIIVTAFSCGDEVEFNTPAFQGDRANALWRADDFYATISSNNVLTITGTNQIETVNLIVPTVAQGTYNVGNVDTIEAQYVSASGVVYTTNNRPDEGVSIYPEIGEIIIDDIDIANATFTGTFRFLAFNTTGTSSVGYTNGIFFKIPLRSGIFPADPITCTDVQLAATVAATAYTATQQPNADGFVDSVAYETACNAYIQALNEQRNYCADLNGFIQTTIDNLGNCQLPCVYATANTAEAQTQFNATTLGNYITLCNQYTFYLQEQIQFCGDDDGSIQAIIDNLNCNDSDNDGLADIIEDFNGDGDFTNDDSDFDGILNYLDPDDDNDGVPTTNELMLDMDGNLNDTDGDGQADYFDTDDDGDGILTIFEDLNGNGDPTDDDTDGDGTPNYLDNDDDDDGTLTISENADPNGDGNPADAVDTDANGTPDYLQA